MRDLEQIIDIAYNKRDDIADEMADAFSNTVSYEVTGKYYPATRWEPEEYPDIEVFGYEEYVDIAVQSIIECLGGAGNKSEEQIIIDNINCIMKDIDVDFMDEEKYYDKGWEYGWEDYCEKQAEAEERAYDYYMERKYDESRYAD